MKGGYSAWPDAIRVSPGYADDGSKNIKTNTMNNLLLMLFLPAIGRTGVFWNRKKPAYPEHVQAETADG